MFYQTLFCRRWFKTSYEKWLIKELRRIDNNFFKKIDNSAREQERQKVKIANKKHRRSLRKSLTKRKKEQILKRDAYTCHYCGKMDGDATIDHLIPVTRGGSSKDSNLITACKGCNSDKGNKTHNEYL